ncbi:MAG: UDP-N-acetylmuramoyl-L-alanine--D-glutamate ligase [Planctomycetaceae bacterium]
MGLGSFGGGLGVVRYLHACGLCVTVSDLRSADQLAGTLDRLANLDRVVLRLGEHREIDFTDTDLIVVNPAVRLGHPLIEQARSRGICITSEIGLFWERCRGRIAAVTGTNGKSTTTKLLHHLLQTDGRRAWLGGNIGGSLLPDVDRIGRDDWVVLELSSFQLAALDELQVSPEVAIVTNFAPNHLDWHETIDAYRAAKQTILRWQRAADLAVLNATGGVSAWETRGRRLLFRVEELPRGWHAGGHSPLRGAHQQENAAAAVTAARSMGVSEAAVRTGLETFVGLPHRLQLVGIREGRRCYDDSASTTPESTLAALASFEEPVVLLAGGADKGVDLSMLADGIVTSARAAVLLGAVAPTLHDLIESRLPTTPTETRRLRRVTIAQSLGEAVEQALDVSEPGDVVLLSPGCASYGWFDNYVERGLAFTELVRSEAV